MTGMLDYHICCICKETVLSFYLLRGFIPSLFTNLIFGVMSLTMCSTRCYLAGPLWEVSPLHKSLNHTGITVFRY